MDDLRNLKPLTTGTSKPLVPGDVYVASISQARKFVAERGITLDKPIPENAHAADRCFIKIGENSTGILTLRSIIETIQSVGRVYRSGDITLTP